MSEDNIQLVLSKIESFRELMNERFDKNEEAHKRVDDHLCKLNGQVAKNTEFRNKGIVYVSVGVFLATTLVSYLISQ